MIDLKELNDLIEEETKVQKKTLNGFKENKYVLRFIKKTGLIPGDIKVPSYVIYYHFMLWCRPRWIPVLGKCGFFRTFSRYFTQKRTGQQRYYMINNSIDLSEEFYEKAKKFDKIKTSRKKTKQSK